MSSLEDLTRDLKITSSSLNASAVRPQIAQSSGGWFSGSAQSGSSPPVDITTTTVHIASLAQDLEVLSVSILDRLVQAFSHLDLMSSESDRMTSLIRSKKAKRFASELEEEDKTIGPPVGKVGSCACRTDPLCAKRCPCAKAGVECTTLCRCGERCESSHRDWSKQYD